VDLGLTDFKTPEEYLAMDDYTVWTALKGCKKSKRIIEDLERRKMIKCAYERTFYEKDPMVMNIFSRDAYRKQLRQEIAEEAKVEPETVTIDVPTVPSVPNHHAMLAETVEIPVFHRTHTGEKVPQRLSEISRIFETLRGFINVLRVYTDEENRERVGRASSRILDKIPASARVSY